MYIPLRCYSHGSILLSQNKPGDIVKRLDELEIDSCAITDMGNISMSIQFFNAMNKAGKKPILGMTLFICNDYASIKSEENSDCKELIVLCKNLRGWKTLLQIISYTNRPEHFHKVPRLSLRELKEFDNESLVFLSDKEVIPYKILNNYYTVPMPKPFYMWPHQAADNRILLCNKFKMPLIEATNRLGMPQFHTNEFYLQSYEDMLKSFNKKDLQQTIDIANQIETFDILNNPKLPDFQCGNISQNEHLRELCREGFKSRQLERHRRQEYIDRIKKELTVIEEAKLAGYFLIVQDIVNYVKTKGIVGAGRGSASGCLISYLLGITEVDPIKYDLLFERFYNSGRNTKDRISLPDIDLDVPSQLRSDIIQYIKSKYGQSCVGQMITFQTMQGGRALTDVLRHTTEMGFGEIKSITKLLPEESKIAPQLKDMKNRLGYSSIIRWALEKTPKKFLEWCELNNEKYTGDCAVQFEQAIRLEDTNIAQSKHPAGVVISKSRLDDFCPVVIDKDKNLVCGLVMDDLEAVGGVKFDILGVKVLDKLMKVKSIVSNKETQI